jgi:pimeloyl-ACP methyl ester carboxylesterase
VNSGLYKLPALTARYAVTSYRIQYLTRDGRGNEVLASGLVSVPVKVAGATSPVISYQHGTIFQDAEVPSNKVIASEAPIVMASLGYIVVSADYVGYAASRGIEHPYILSSATASAVIDLLTAATTWRQRNGVADNGQLFLVGYSEGGYATVAAQRAMQVANNGLHAKLVASVPGAGPYHLGVTMDAVLARVRDENPIIASLLNPGLLSRLGSTLRDEVRRLLLRAVVPNDATVVFQPTFLDNYLADDTAAMDRDSNVHDWTPARPIHFYHGRDDTTVVYSATLRALQTMQGRGARNVSLTDCTATPASHLGCVQPYFGFMLERLASLARDL